MAPLALVVICLASAYLFGLGACALLAPARARAFLMGFVGTGGLHALELALRLLVGGALIVRAPATLWPTALNGLGWLLVVTTVLLALLPWRWHRAFAQRSVGAVLRFLPALGLASLGLGALLLYAVFAQ